MFHSLKQSASALDARARKAARSAGYAARQSRWRKFSLDNHGGYTIFDPDTNFPVAGFDYSMTAAEVIAWSTAD